MRISGLLAEATNKLSSSGSSTPRLDALILLEHVTGKDRGWLLAHQDKETGTLPQSSLQVSSLERFQQAIKRRAAGEPLGYITGVKEFYGLELEVSPAVMIPRPESEVLVDMAVELAPEKSRLIDLGTGSGSIAIAIAKQRPDLIITAGDISASALKLAKRNAEKHGLSLRYINTNLLDKIDGGYETIVANLPYVPSGFKAQAQKELSFEPATALYSGIDGLDHYRRLLGQLHDNSLTKLLIIEADPRQHDALIKLAHEHGWQLKRQQDFGLAFDK